MCRSISFSNNRNEERLIGLNSLAATCELLPALGMKASLTYFQTSEECPNLMQFKELIAMSGGGHLEGSKRLCNLSQALQGVFFQDKASERPGIVWGYLLCSESSFHSHLLNTPRRWGCQRGCVWSLGIYFGLLVHTRHSIKTLFLPYFGLVYRESYLVQRLVVGCSTPTSLI